ncbi:MAG: flagellar transcriptional regulator FlhD [Sulfuritalea sp.]|nr:flagellar transcriptional regulator FlhD [Sulfuritalea sp.]
MTITPTELYALNSRFLVLMQQAAKKDAADAARTFRASESVCERIAALSLDQLDGLAKTNALVFTCRLDEAALDFAVANPSSALRAVMLEARGVRN